MDYLREAFNKIKEDINFLQKEVNSLKVNTQQNKEEITKFFEISRAVKEINEKIDSLGKNRNFENNSTNNDFFSTHSTQNSTQNLFFKPLKPQNSCFSIGNKGASTDRQTDTSTDRQTDISSQNKQNSISNALEFLDSLDNIKKEIRLKFKRITDQEFLVFSTIYQMDEEYGGTDYKALSKRLNLSESSIRDYIGRLLKKEIPIEKVKINNKNIQLSISKNLKKIVSLPTILQLRDI
jgi:ABC-type Zn2+ transport system substrate-binding protein/surface adhesin